jgi:splicing factor 3B subunit 2
VKKEKEKEPEKLDKMENSAVPKKKGFEEEHKDSDDDSSDDEQVRPTSSRQEMDAGQRWSLAGLLWLKF